MSLLPIARNGLRKKKTKKEKFALLDSKGMTLNSSQKHNTIKCFRCLKIEHIASQSPNKKIMLLRDDGGIDSASDCENKDNDSMPTLEDVEESVEYPA